MGRVDTGGHMAYLWPDDGDGAEKAYPARCRTQVGVWLGVACLVLAIFMEVCHVSAACCRSGQSVRAN